MKTISAIGLILSCLLLGACSDTKYAQRHLEEEGYHDIHLTGYRWLNWCQKDDFVTEFNATAPSGRHATGVVCSTWIFPGYTVVD